MDMVGEGTTCPGRRSFSGGCRSSRTMRPLQRLLPRDPRDLQIAFLASFLVLGVAFLGLRDRTLDAPAAAGLTGCARSGPASGCLRAALQRATARRSSPRWGCRCCCGPMPSGCLRSRRSSAIGAKFVLRVRGKHVFNPGNLGLGGCILLTSHAWSSPSQWGESAGAARVVRGAGAGGGRTASFRSDVSLAFLGQLGAAQGRPRALPGPAPRGAAAPALRGQPHPLHLLHDLRPEDDARTTARRACSTPPAWPGSPSCSSTASGGTTPSSGRSASCLPLVPLLDRLLPAARFQWPAGQSERTDACPPTPCPRRHPERARAPRRPRAADAFCGFYVGKADTQLFNEARQVVLVRDGERTVLTMSNDYKGELTDFALVVPVPTVLKREQIHVGERKYVERLDAYSAPRLVEYFDADPCAQRDRARTDHGAQRRRARRSGARWTRRGARALGVTVEAQYTVGEYDIVILSAKQSDGLETWLRESGYKIPPRAAAALAAVHQAGHEVLRGQGEPGEAEGHRLQLPAPAADGLRVARSSCSPSAWAWPTRRGRRTCVVYALTRKGRVESTNYKTVKVPSDVDVPALREGATSATSTRRSSSRPHEKEEPPGAAHRVRLGHGLVRPVRGGPAHPRGAAAAWASSGWTSQQGQRRHGAGGSHGAHAAARALRRRALPRGPGLPGDGRPAELPGPLHPPAPLPGRRRSAARWTTTGTAARRRKKEAETLASLTGWAMQTSARRWARMARR